MHGFLLWKGPQQLATPKTPVGTAIASFWVILALITVSQLAHFPFKPIRLFPALEQSFSQMQLSHVSG